MEGLLIAPFGQGASFRRTNQKLRSTVLLVYPQPRELEVINTAIRAPNFSHASEFVASNLGLGLIC